MSFIFSAHSQSLEQNFRQHGPITLVDNTATGDPEEQGERSAASSDSERATPVDIRLSKTISRKGTKEAWRDERAKWKYRKYQESRYVGQDIDTSGGPSRPGISVRTSTNETGGTKISAIPTEPTTPSTPAAQSATPTTPKTSFLQRKVKGLFAKRRYTGHEGESVIDVLWENQRGWFFFGMPLFSSQSLLNFDPPAWLNGYGKPSAVNITNAQVPDPGWQWDWHTWYVDMSVDVDEEGWQYSFMFQNTFPWHGTHPWVHSFVRRRRWIRRRVRKRRKQEQLEEKHGVPEPHKFNQDYFTIHAATPIGKSAEDKGYPASKTFTNSQHASTSVIKGEDEDTDDEVENISILLRRLRRSTVDRDKVNLVLQFIDQGGEDVFHLADEIPNILSLFLYQHSRRRLLSSMLRKMSAASDHREEHQRREAPEFKNEKRKIDDLLRAVKVTEKEVQRLEFWSDVRGIVRQGESFSAVADTGVVGEDAVGWDHGWAGLDANDNDKGRRFTAGETATEVKEKGKQAQSTMEELHPR